MNSKTEVSVLPPYAITIEKNVPKLSSINELRFSNLNWYRKHRRLEGLHDDPFGFPQELPPTTHRWKALGIPERCSEPFYSHIPFSDMYTNYDRKRIDPVTNMYVLSNNTRYGLEEVYHRYYCAKRELNPFLQRERNLTAVKQKILTQRNVDCLDTQRKQLLAEAGARNYKSSAPFYTQRDSSFVTQAGDFNFQAPELSKTKKNTKLEAVEKSFNDKSSWKFQIAKKKPKPGSRMYERNSVLEAKGDIIERQRDIRSAIRGEEINAKSGNEKRLKNLVQDDENDFEGMQNVGYVNTPTEEYMKEIGVGAEPVRVSSYREVLVHPPDSTRQILSRDEDNSILKSSPTYHSMSWKTQLNRDFHAIYQDPLPEEDLCTNVADVLDTKMKYGHYHHLDTDLTALKLKLILK